MEKYFKNIENGYIVYISTGSGAEEISKDEYDSIMLILRNRPTPPSGYDYALRADTLEWELVELPPMPEPELTDEELTDEELVEILLGGAT